MVSTGLGSGCFAFVLIPFSSVNSFCSSKPNLGFVVGTRLRREDNWTETKLRNIHS